MGVGFFQRSSENLLICWWLSSLGCWYDGYNYLILEYWSRLAYLGLIPLIHDKKFSQNIVEFGLLIFCWGFFHRCSWEILVSSFLYYSYFPLSLDIVVFMSDIHLGKFSVFLKNIFCSLLSLLSSCHTHYVYFSQIFLLSQLFDCFFFRFHI